MPVEPIEVVRTEGQRWQVSGELLPMGENLVVIERFIGMVNFFEYFGLKGISQGRTFIALGNILPAITLIGFFIWTLIRPSVPFNQNGMLTIAILLILAYQGFRSIEFLTQYMEASGLAQSVWNSLRVGLYTTVISVSLAFLYAYGIHRSQMFGKAFFRIVAMIPLFAPTMLYGLSLVYMFGNKGVITTGFFDRFPWLAWDIHLYGFTGIEFFNPFNLLYGTMALLILCNIIHFYTVSFLTATTAIRQLDKEFESVAESMAIPFYKTFLRVTVPVCFPAILEIAVFYFVSSMATVSAVIFLYSSDNPLASVAVINMDDAGDTAPAAAMCMLIVFANV